MSEIELKFGIDPAHAEALGRTLRRAGTRRTTIESHYVDTADFRLGGAGLALRLRRTDRFWEQTLKAPTDRLGERIEETVARPGRWGAEGPPLDPSLHDGTAAGQALLRALGEKPGAFLAPSSRTRIVRRSVEIALASATVELALDRGTIEAGERSVPLLELEIELKAGDARAMVAWAREGVVAHGLWLRAASKAERGERLARGEASATPAKAAAPRLRRSMSLAALRRSALRSCLAQVLANAGTVADGQVDDETVHQLRVGLRRLRTAWRELSDPTSGDDPPWERPLVDAFHALGMLRDRRVVVDSLKDRLVMAGSPEPRLPLPDGPPLDATRIVRTPAFQVALLEAMALTLAHDEDDAASNGRATKRKEASDALDLIAARLDALHGRLRRAARSFAREPPAEQHRARKRLKRLRYLAELVASLYASKPVDRYLARLRPAQDRLGRHVDSLVGLDLARRAAEAGDGAAWFNVGWLSAELRGSAAACEKALRRAARADRFWRPS